MFVNDPFRIGLQKTGFTNEAGHCLIIVTMVGCHPVLIVLLGDPNAQAHFHDAVDPRRWIVTAQR
jgi:D-alanyl-D-alanine endopeptidase (penicillin-binding protein 7)